MADSSDSTRPDGSRSRLLFRDQIGEAFASLRERPSRTIVSGLLIAVSAALILVVTALGATASHQISRRFDAQRATLVAVRPAATPGQGGSGALAGASLTADELTPLLDQFPRDSRSRLHELRNVVASGTLLRRSSKAHVSLSILDANEDPTGTDLLLSDPSFAHAARLTIDGRWIGIHDENAHRRVAILGTLAAQKLGIHHPGGTIVIDRVTFGLIGIVRASEAAPQIAGSVVIGRNQADGQTPKWEVDDSSSILIRTVPGAARAVAGQVPRQLWPDHPQRLSASAPLDPSRFRESLEGDTQQIMRAFAGLGIVLGILTTALVSLSTVNSRRGIIGLQCSLGATSGHIRRLVVTETFLIGIVSGVIGVAGGLAAVGAICLARHWQLVMPGQLPIWVILGTGAAGVLAGLTPAWVAARMDPVDSLRHE